ncbi:MAG TPA: YCF48-related protein, partial [Puia sp.]|nr:YCF48-related protein [Puia sp.]
CIKVKFTDRQTGFILNNNGDLFKTTDQGGHWQRTDHFSRVLCMDIAYSTGVIAGDSGVAYMSHDHGVSWSAVKTGTTDALSMISIVSADTLFLGSTTGNLYETTDGGNSWSALTCQHQINCTWFVDSKTGFAGGPGSLILKTVDGGVTWQQKEQSNSFPSGILAIQFLNAQTGYALREYYDVQVTHDGGNTWATYNGKYQMTAIDMVDATVGYIAGENGAICQTTDGGMTWNPVIPSNGFKDGYQLYSLHFISADTGFIVGLAGRILKTVDGGTTWNRYSPTYLPITAVSFPTPAVGYAADWNYTYKTTDSGRSWVPLSLTTGTSYASQSRFEQAHFINADTGFFVSNGYFQLHTTTDGGQTWTASNPAVYSWDDAPRLCFVDSRNGFLSVTNYNTGLILRTRDGGLSWTQAWATGSGQPYYLGRVSFADTLTGFGIESQNLYKTADGGTSWQPVYSPAPGGQYTTLTDVCFTDKQNGFIGNSGDGLAVTHDGGSSWATVSTPYTSGGGINAIRFFNGKIGYFTDGNQFGPAGYGNIYRTLDGGVTWRLDMNFGGTGIGFTPDSNVVVNDFAGGLLKTGIRAGRADSLSTGLGDDCNKDLSAIVSVPIGEVDSIAFEIVAADGSIQRVAASPASVSNGRATCTAATPPLKPDVAYAVRLRFVENGVAWYGDPARFVASNLPRPSIYDSSGVLRSSADSGNQWFLNGAAIANAVRPEYTPKATGRYSVQVTRGGC